LAMLTEGAIRDALLERVHAAVKGESVDIAMFYVADRGIVESLLAASRRGVSVRLILDPNKDAFGRATSGLPNQPAASELVSESKGAIHVRWYRTHGERFHTKLVMIYGTERLWLTLGSANLTRRSVGDYNLEANLAIEVARAAPLALQTLEYFETLWSNRASLGIEYTADFAAYADPAQSHYWLYRFMEGTGMSDF
jgi:phosphatidylserine/phosphatidylglycerophosphate/cardiolipin synthase-like enzyme